MNRSKWMKKAEKGETPPSVFLAKLMEEVGEVGNAILEGTPKDLLSEVEHVEFIAGCFRKSLVRQGT